MALQDAAIELLKQDAGATSQLFLLFLSDGAPSDHKGVACEHGVYVWDDDPQGPIGRNGKRLLQWCPFGGCAASRLGFPGAFL
jgi:hypothetical protein